MRNAKGEGSLWQTDDGWRGYVTVNGRRRYFQAKTKTVAAKKRRELLNLRDTVGLSTGRSVTVEQWLNHWIAITEGKHKPKTTERYKDTINRYMSATLRRTPITKLSTEKLEDEYANLSDKYAPSTVHQVHALLHVALKLAVQRGKITYNPASMVVNKPKLSKARTEVLSEDDVQAIEQALTGSWNRARWMVALSLGLRPGEALALEWGDIDWEGKTITVHQQIQMIDGKMCLTSSTKGKAGYRTIPLPDFLAVILREHWPKAMRMVAGAQMWSPDGKDHSWCFTSRVHKGRPLTPAGDYTNWQRILSDAGLQPARPYIARHTAASVLLAHGVDIATISAILGHADSAFTLRTYVHSLEESKRAAGVTLDAIFADKVQNRVQPQTEVSPNGATAR